MPSAATRTGTTGRPIADIVRDLAAVLARQAASEDDAAESPANTAIPAVPASAEPGAPTK